MHNMPMICLLAMKPELADAFAQAFSGADRVEIARTDFVSFMDAHPRVSGIVSTANSFGLMTGGLDKAMRDYFGKSLQDAARLRIQTEWFGEQPMGTCMAVDIPGRPGTMLLHTPVMRTPARIQDPTLVYTCMRAVLITALRLNLDSLLIPAFGGGTGRIPDHVIAHYMRRAWDQIKSQLDSPHMDDFRTAIRI